MNEIIEKVKELHEQGKSTYKIGAILNLDRREVGEILKGKRKRLPRTFSKAAFPALKKIEDKLLPNTEEYFNVYDDNWIG